MNIFAGYDMRNFPYKINPPTNDAAIKPSASEFPVSARRGRASYPRPANSPPAVNHRSGEMTIKELIEKLEKYDGKTEVQVSVGWVSPQDITRVYKAKGYLCDGDTEKSPVVYLRI